MLARTCTFAAVLHASIAALVTVDNTKPKLDTHGNIVNAHDGTFLRIDGMWYYHAAEYGLCREPATTGCAPTSDHCGLNTQNNVSIWRSPDLSSGSWERLGTAVRCTDIPGCQKLFRPHVVFNPHTRKYVLFANVIYPHPIGGGRTTIWSADAPEGPFVLETLKANLSRGSNGDFDVIVHSDGSAYIGYGAEHYLSIEPLTSDYYDALPPAEGGRSATVIGGFQNGTIFPDDFVEAPGFFERGGTYYVLYGHCCCFCMQGSGIIVYSAPHPTGPWTAQGDGDIGCVANGSSAALLGGTPTPHQGCLYEGDNLVSVTGAQQNVVIPVPGSGNTTTYVWTGDLWQQAPDGIKGHEYQYWFPLAFDAKGKITQPKHVETFVLDVE